MHGRRHKVDGGGDRLGQPVATAARPVDLHTRAPVAQHLILCTKERLRLANCHNRRDEVRVGRRRARLDTGNGVYEGVHGGNVLVGRLDKRVDGLVGKVLAVRRALWVRNRHERVVQGLQVALLHSKVELDAGVFRRLANDGPARWDVGHRRLWRDERLRQRQRGENSVHLFVRGY